MDGDSGASTAEAGTHTRSTRPSPSPVKVPPSFGSDALFGKSNRDAPEFFVDMETASPPTDLQEIHLRFLMSSTAEQPDSSGRTSSFNVWLTVLIAALAAAILS